MRKPGTLDELAAVYRQPLLELLFQAQRALRRRGGHRRLQRCALLSIKTGGCPEDCAYCAQSAHYRTGVRPEPMLTVEAVLAEADRAKRGGATRFCMATAWPRAPDGRLFDRVLDMVRGVRSLGLEVCVTLGTLGPDQAARLKRAGLTAYNHNLDTSRRYYPRVVTTRTYDQRLQTLRTVQQAGIALCSGGIIGMGETPRDRLMMLDELLRLPRPPESIPINCLIPIPGTPLQDAPRVDAMELVRLIATARIAFPAARVRLSAGRSHMSRELQVLCFLAGADSIFIGEKLLTAPNQSEQFDAELLRTLGPAAEL